MSDRRQVAVARTVRELSVGYQQIADDLREQIGRGRLKPGSGLPSETQLAERYKVSRMTVRHGLKILELDGIIKVIPAKGRVVVGQNGAPPRAAQPAAKTRVLYLSGPAGADFAHPYIAGIHAGVSQTFSEAGVDCEMRFETSNTQMPEQLFAGEHAGILLVGIYRRDVLEALKNNERPCVLLNHRPLYAADAVSTDNFGAGYMAAQQMAARGHRRLGCLHWRIDDPAFRDRTAGFLQGAEDAGIARENIRVLQRPGWVGHDARLGEMITELRSAGVLPSALFVCTDELASRLIDVLGTLGLRVPADVSIVGFDNFSRNRFPGQPALTTIEQPGLAVGLLGARKLLTRIARPETPPSVELIAPKWIEGESLSDFSQ
ncbi:MAG TPA: GntR family transcriptional regulator [Planctomycetota bacterium]|nr:GntR family transcriptional regulator [Planctomycetota bacterium]